MGKISDMVRRIKFSLTDAAIAAVVALCVINALCEFWAWLGTPPG